MSALLGCAMTSKTPQVSVGMPVYNGMRFLRQSLDSILAQTFKDFELLISDNASSDHTQDICREYVQKDRRIRYMRNPINLGATRNYNRLVELSSGRYFRWAPADDLFAPTSLERCVATLEKNEDVVLCYPKTILIDGAGNQLEPYEDKLDLRSPDPSERFRQALQIGRANALYGLMRSDVLRKISPMRSYPGADVDLLIDLCLYGRFFEIPEALFFRRMHAEAYSSLTTLKEQQAFFDPSTSGRIHLSHWKRLFVRLTSVWHAPLGVSSKLHLSYLLARGAVTARREFFKETTDAVQETTRRREVENRGMGTL